MHAISFRASEGLVEPQPTDRDFNVNGRHGVLGPRPSSAGSAKQGGTSTSSSSGEESDGEVPDPSSSQPSPEHRPPLPDQGRINQVTCPPKPLTAASSNDLENAGPSGIGMAAFRDPSPVMKPGASENRRRQLESLRRMEERIRRLSRSASGSSSNSIPPAARSNPTAYGNNVYISPCPSESKSQMTKNVMTMSVLDISHVLTDECYVEWLRPKFHNATSGGPEEKILYTLIAGKGELIMFGGIQKDATSVKSQAQPLSNAANAVSNSLHFITAPRGII